MKVFSSFLKSRSINVYAPMIAVGLLNSALNTAFMVIISKYISGGGPHPKPGVSFLLFILSLAACFGLNYIFNSYIIRLGENIVLSIELNLVAKVKEASFSRFCTMSFGEFYSALNHVRVLGEAPSLFFNLFNSLLTILCCVFYLLWMAPIYGLAMAMLIGVIVAGHFFRILITTKKFKKLRLLQIEYFKHINDLLEGFKDLKMSGVKRERIFSCFIEKNKTESHTIEKKLRSDNFLIGASSTYIWYLLLGIVVLLIPRAGEFNLENTSTFVLILLYIIAPLSSVTAFFEFYSRLRSASESLDAVNARFAAGEFEGVVQGIDDLPKFSGIKFENVGFDYVQEEHVGQFSLGPISLEIGKGEVTFLVGGNGSGKSTFLNLLTGIMRPTRGNIYYSDSKISSATYQCYRNKIAVVFHDAYVFNFNYEDITISGGNARLLHYWKMTKMDGFLGAADMLERKDSLSKGQQKRIALILALLVDKEVLIFDEWAAEQDPDFKSYFYRDILQVLKREGKTIIAITHDEEYFPCADQVVKFMDGKIVSVGKKKDVYNPVCIIP